jgi:hypothetical protein
MKKLNFYLLLLFTAVLYSCGTIHKQMVFKCKNEKIVLSANIPTFQKKEVLGRLSSYQNCDRNYFFTYSDSIILYFESSDFSSNIYNIKTFNDSIYRLRFEYGAGVRATNKAIQRNYYSREELLLLNLNIDISELDTFDLADLKMKLPELPDTLELSGLNEKGLYWKDIYINGISIGYDNVPLEKKELFDNCLKNTKIKFKQK